MTTAEREYLALVARRAYELEVQLGLATHHVGNVEGGETEALDDCCQRAQSLRETLEKMCNG